MTKCRECGLETTSIVNHVQTAHADLANKEQRLSAVEAYSSKHDCMDEILGSLDKKKKTAKKAVKTEATSEKPKEEISTVPTKKKESPVGTVKIAGVSMATGLGGEFVPELNDAYHFPLFTTDVCYDIKENKKILLTGHAGTGKSSLAEQLAARVNQGILRVNLNAQITVGDFVGMWTVKSGETVWVDGVLPKAMREGLWLVLEEVDFAEPAILSLLNTVLEKGGKLALKEKGHEIIKPHENFRIFATANTVGAMQSYRSLYQGTSVMNEAFLDRFRCYLVDYMPKKDEVSMLCKTIPAMNEKIGTNIVDVAGMIREAFLKEEVSSPFSTRRVIDWAELMMRHGDPMSSAQIAIFSKVSPEDAEVVKGIIKRVMPTSKK